MQNAREDWEIASEKFKLVNVFFPPKIKVLIQLADVLRYFLIKHVRQQQQSETV